MARKKLNIGCSANSGTGDTLRDASKKINDNFSELYVHIDDVDNPHKVTPEQIGAVPEHLVGAANGIATLDGTGRLRGSQKPLYHWFEIADKPSGLRDTASHPVITISDNKAVVKGDLTIDGDLNVIGRTITVEKTIASVGDSIILLNAGLSPDAAAICNAGLEINRGKDQNASLTWNEHETRWFFSGWDVGGVGELSSRSVVSGTARLDSLSASSADVEIIRAGTMIAEEITGDLNGLALTAIRLNRPAEIKLIGAISGAARFDGSEDLAIETALEPVELGVHTIGSYVRAIDASGPGLTVKSSGTSGSMVTITLDASADDEPGTIVLRSRDGRIKGAFLGDLEGTATQSHRWTTPRALQLQGAISGSALIDGSSNITLATAFSSEAISPSARRLAEPRRFHLRGAVEGEAFFDGSADATIDTTMRVRPEDIGAYSSSGGPLSGFIEHTITEDIEATGSTQELAQPLSSTINVIAKSNGSSDCAVRLPPSIPGVAVVIINDSAADVMLFPAYGERLDFNQINIPLALEPSKRMTVVGSSKRRWFCI